eukprot:CAMPEP_0194697426 /NCGR_PEP_ID=MMETSP0295-20121207/23413_1 /TAXON_ID=39354 /ORGANISM="Heterosigma akashiwo, Strain CCMP2393" /LENGTH=69 /DNA_ID=CAMNT_0039590083 /DNA_START=9 /DNA_END=218 /DNA_ORIENTATION=+
MANPCGLYWTPKPKEVPFSGITTRPIAVMASNPQVPNLMNDLIIRHLVMYIMCSNLTPKWFSAIFASAL